MGFVKHLVSNQFDVSRRGELLKTTCQSTSVVGTTETNRNGEWPLTGHYDQLR